MASNAKPCSYVLSERQGAHSVAKKTVVRMSVRILDKEGSEIASFFRGELGEVVLGFSDTLRDALLAFRKEYPKTRFIDVEFT
jgi:hypothetical protein